mgnify:CR=1 FL=1
MLPDLLGSDADLELPRVIQNHHHPYRAPTSPIQDLAPLGPHGPEAFPACDLQDCGALGSVGRENRQGEDPRPPGFVRPQEVAPHGPEEEAPQEKKPAEHLDSVGHGMAHRPAKPPARASRRSRL